MTSHMYNRFRETLRDLGALNFDDAPLVASVRPKPRWLPFRLWWRIVHRVVEIQPSTVNVMWAEDEK